MVKYSGKLGNGWKHTIKAVGLPAFAQISTWRIARYKWWRAYGFTGRESLSAHYLYLVESFSSCNQTVLDAVPPGFSRYWQ